MMHQSKVKLAEYQDAWVKRLQQLLNHSSISDWLLMVPFPYTLADAQSWIEKTKAFAADKNPVEIPRAILYGEKLAGGIGLSKLNGHSGEIGYWIAEEFQGKGIASEAIRQMVAYGFDQLGLKRIYAHCFAGNQSSEKLLLKCGFEHERFLPQFYNKNGKLLDVNLYAITRK